MKDLRSEMSEILYDPNLEVEGMLDAILTAIRSKIPKKAIFGIAGVDEEPSIGIGRVQGYNQAIDEINKNLRGGE